MNRETFDKAQSVHSDYCLAFKAEMAAAIEDYAEVMAGIAENCEPAKDPEGDNRKLLEIIFGEKLVSLALDGVQAGVVMARVDERTCEVEKAEEPNEDGN